MSVESPLASANGAKGGASEVENAHFVERVGTHAQDDSEKNSLPGEGDGADRDGTHHKVHHPPVL